ncbi:ankyrin repeat and zinc finger domain-containing protein 1 [Neodiprion lecontei]|uniref:Ankyrin repeat and zinc finger domain-containing protein 1 n=1 Tax=Neodiprion lecontei TaxID=441921 RepID=A0A6J0CFR3_NEOLC|nr:ankyrin repeat and zinc finger domain-containing protein 1 [Neodiprion lecontei]XP_046596115.1 ankyrin repeat and zinc finger domain-containing protein 1 [Neodiprion lecontei]
MDHQVFRIHNRDDFVNITKGIKVAQCMQLKSASALGVEKVLCQLEELVVSDSLSCSFCNTVFEDKAQQRLHYKLDWHRYNLKQRLGGLKSISEGNFSLMADKDDVSSISGSESESENDDETGTSETGSSRTDSKAGNSKTTSSSILIPVDDKNRKEERKRKIAESVSDSSDTELDEDALQKKRAQELLLVASRHSKVFFENDEGNIFSIYRCLLHNKKEIPELDIEMVAQALESGKNTTWTVIMLGGGHFAAAVFQNGIPVVHKTYHCYTVRAKQGGSQSSRDNRSAGTHPKSAGASLRRYNEAALIQHIQEILESWTTHLVSSSLILYRAVGPQNRTVLFGGKNPPLDKNDPRLRPLPFPTRRATFNEVKRVYDILSSLEVYGSATEFTDSFPISPKQPIRKKVSKVDILDGIPESTPTSEIIPPFTNGAVDNEKSKRMSQTSLERQYRSLKSHIDRAKPRKSPRRPLPDIVARLAQSSSESESDDDSGPTNEVPLIEQSLEMDFNEHLQAFQDTVPRYIKAKKGRRQKRKSKKEKNDEPSPNASLYNLKQKLWTACKLGDIELLSSALESALSEIQRCQSLEEQLANGQEINEDPTNFMKMDNVVKLVNESNEEGNTPLHLAANGGYLKVVWSLLEIGSDPCNKNKKFQTPYTATVDKETRNTFRRFMAANPNKFDYTKSQIPGPLTDEMELELAEKKKLLKKAKREKEKIKKKELDNQRQEEALKKRFLNLSDREKRALAAERRIMQQGGMIFSRCFECGTDMTNQIPFEYNANRFCSMVCLKSHRGVKQN